MPYFKHKKTGDIVERSEEFANQVLRPQGHYEEVSEPKAVTPKEEEKDAESRPKAVSRKKRAKRGS